MMYEKYKMEVIEFIERDIVRANLNVVSCADTTTCPSQCDETSFDSLFGDC